MKRTVYLCVEGHEERLVADGPRVLRRVVLVDRVPRLAPLEEALPVGVGVNQRVGHVQQPEVVDDEADEQQQRDVRGSERMYVAQFSKRRKPLLAK